MTLFIEERPYRSPRGGSLPGGERLPDPPLLREGDRAVVEGAGA